MSQVYNIFSTPQPASFKISSDKLEQILNDHEEWLLSRGENGTRANLSNVDLNDADLKGVSLMRAILRNTKLKNVNFEGADLRETDFASANMKNSILRGAKLEGANLEGANLKDAVLDNIEGMYANFSLSELENSSFYGAILEGADFSDTNAKNNDFSASILKRANFNDSVLRNSNFSGANLGEATLMRTNLMNTNFTSTNLMNTNFAEANMDGVNLLDTDIAVATGIEQHYYVEALLQERQKLQIERQQLKTGEAPVRQDTDYNILEIYDSFFTKQASWFKDTMRVWMLLIAIFATVIGYKLYIFEGSLQEFLSQGQGFSAYEWIGVALLMISVVGIIIPASLRCKKIAKTLSQLAEKHETPKEKISPKKSPKLYKKKSNYIKFDQ